MLLAALKVRNLWSLLGPARMPDDDVIGNAVEKNGSSNYAKTERRGRAVSSSGRAPLRSRSWLLFSHAAFTPTVQLVEAVEQPGNSRGTTS